MGEGRWVSDVQVSQVCEHTHPSLRRVKCGHLKASDALPDHPSNALSGPLPQRVMRDFGPTGGRARCASSARGHMLFFSSSGVVTVLAFVHSNLNASRKSSTVAVVGSNSMTLATHPIILE